MKLHTILRAACMLLLGAFTLHAQEPNLINYQGRLTDESGNPVTGNVEMEVLVYDAPTGGNLTYSENIGEVAVANGTYSFQFGSQGDGIIAVLIGFSDYLALRVNGVEEATRTRLLAVPYAMKSADAQALLAEARVLSFEGDLDFGGVLPGGSRSREVSVTNEGFQKLEIYGVQLPEGFSIQPPIYGTVTLKPYETINATITFTPEAAQSYSGNLVIQSNKTSGSDFIPCSGEGGIQPTILSNEETLSGLSGDQGSKSYFSFYVPWYATSLLFQTSNGTGDVDLYVRYGDLPTFSEWNYRPGLDGNEELVNATPTPGEWFAMLHGFSLYSGVDFLVKYEGAPPEFVYVEGGILPQSSELAGTQVVDFEICEYEVTWAEWQEVRDWAVENGYDDLADVGQGNGARHPVQNVNWFQVIKWLNAKSEMEGLVPAYTTGGEVYRSGEFGWSDPNILQNSDSNGYRLPSEAEWEWAARGGILSQGFTYSGSNDPDAVAWHAGNSGGTTHTVGTKLPNELGLYDMSGSISEWCWDVSDETSVVVDGYYFRRIKDGSWWHPINSIEVSIRNHMPPNYAFDHRGFRIARSVEQPMVTVQGGTLVTTNELNGAVVSTFEIGKYEVTWAEWQDVRDWAVANGYSDLAGVGEGSAGDHPVRNVNWYDAVKWMNAKSEMEGLVPVYSVNATVYRSGESAPIVDGAADGYRLPTEAEWEWAARGGVSSQGYTYSGSNDVDTVAWYLENSSGSVVDLLDGRGTWPVGQKVANELGLHDMSGNVWEWCEDIVHVHNSTRRMRGSSWGFIAGAAAVSNRGFDFNPDYSQYSVGFRIARSVAQPSNMVSVQGGTLVTSNELNGTVVSTFEIGKYEVTWDEWQEVRAWAVANGYDDLANVGAGSAGDHPVRDVNWYDVVKWMNAKSEREGLVPVYQVSGSTYKTGETAPTINSGANGYRLPTEVEWEWAARGGVSSQGYTYSGSNDVGEVAWIWQNSGAGTKTVGTKAANELGIYDMSGNVWEWCEDLVYGSYRRLRGGSWFGYDAGGAAVADRAYYEYAPVNRNSNVGFRMARSVGL